MVAAEDHLLCADSLPAGPGVLYNLSFRAATTPQITTVAVRRAQFYRAGCKVGPVVITDSKTQIGPLSDAAPPASAGGVRLRVAPNPFNPMTVIQVESGAAGRQDLLVSDVAGRPVRTLLRGRFGAGSRQVVWDGRDDRGTGLPAGVYFVRLEAAGHRTAERVVLLK